MPISSLLASRLIQLQSFKETVWGTQGQATARWMALSKVPEFKAWAKSEVFDEWRGNLAPGFTSAILRTGGEYKLEGFATYEDLLYLLYHGLQGGISPTGTDPYTYVFTGPTNAPWNSQSYTFEYGYDIGALFATGCLPQKWSLKGEASKEWTYTMEGFYQQHNQSAALNIGSSTSATPIAVTITNHGLNTGDQVVISGHLVNTAANGTWTVTKTNANVFTLNTSVGNGVGTSTGTVTKTITPALADRAVEAILFPTTNLYMDASGGTLGATVFTDTMVSMQLDVDTGLKPAMSADKLYPVNWTYEKTQVSLTLGLFYTAAVKAYLIGTLEAGTRSLCRLKSVSGAKSAQVDFSGVLADDPAFYGDKDSAQIVTLKLNGEYDSGAALHLNSTVVNHVASLA